MGRWGRHHSVRSFSLTKGFKLGIIFTGIDEILPGFKKALQTGGADSRPANNS